MSVARVVDGETYADSTYMNTLVDGINAATVAIEHSGTGIYNVLDYEAAADGVTDDTAEIQAAIDDCSDAGGGIVYVPAGTYKVTSLTLATSVQLIGAGMQAAGDAHGTVLLGTAGSDLIVIEPLTGEYIRISDITLSGGRDAIYSDELTVNVYLERVHCSSYSQAGVHIEGSIERWVLRDVLMSGGQYGLWHANVEGSGGNYMDKCHIDNLRCTGQSINGIRVTVIISNGVTWINPVVEFAGQHGIYLDGGLRGWTFLNLITEGNGSSGKANRTTGTINSASNTLTLASGTGWVTGDPVIVKGAGASGTDLNTTATLVSGVTVTTADAATTSVAGVATTNAQYDDVFFDNSIAGSSNTVFLSGIVGSTGSTEKLRYAINTLDASNVLIVNLQNSATIPVYDPFRSANTFGREINVRQGLRTYVNTNVTEDRALDADSTSTAELADVLGTLIADLQTLGVLH
jgi:hypothetical protein